MKQHDPNPLKLAILVTETAQSLNYVFCFQLPSSSMLARDLKSRTKHTFLCMQTQKRCRQEGKMKQSDMCRRKCRYGQNGRRRRQKVGDAEGGSKTRRKLKCYLIVKVSYEVIIRIGKWEKLWRPLLMRHCRYWERETPI